MRANAQKNSVLALGTSAPHPLASVDTKAPHLLALGLQLFGVERRMKWILSEKFLLLLGLLLDTGGQQFVSFYKLVGQ